MPKNKSQEEKKREYEVRYEQYVVLREADVDVDVISETLGVSVSTLSGARYSNRYFRENAPQFQEGYVRNRHAANESLVNELDTLNKRWWSLVRILEAKYGSEAWDESDEQVIEIRRIRQQIDKIDPVKG